MFKLNRGDKVEIKDENTNPIFLNKVFTITNVFNNGYEINVPVLGYLDMSNFEYIQPQTLTIEMASDKDVVVNCRTKEDAEYFCKWLDLHGKKWCDEKRYAEVSQWDRYQQDTCYRVSGGSFANILCYNDMVIIRFTPSMIQNDKIWDIDKPSKINVSETGKSNENRVLSSVVESDVCKITYKKIPVIGKGGVTLFALSQEQLSVYPKITNIKFDSKTTTINIGGKTIRVTCQDCDTYSKEQAITQAIAKYCGYGTKKINELIEKFDIKKEAFKPYLYCDKQNYGEIGNETNLYDIVGRKLMVGDTVEIWCDGKCQGEFVVAMEDNTPFIMGYYGSKLVNGSFEFFNSGHLYKVTLKKSFNEINDGDCIDGVNYIKSPLKIITQ